MTLRLACAASASLLALVVAGCGGGGSPKPDGTAQKTTTLEKTVTAPIPATTTRPSQTGFDPERIYRDEAPGVVTVVSVLGASGSPFGGSNQQEGVGSGFVVSESGEIATNAHVVSNGAGPSLKRAKQVFVQFGDNNQVPAKIVGLDPNSDVALIKVDPKGLNLRPLPLGHSTGLIVGSPVAAIGSPFDKAQSLSVGVISAVDRPIQSLNGDFSITGAIQTDAAINHGNSGGPLLDAQGRVLGINSQIQSTGGGGEGVGFAVPVDTVKRSLDEIRRTGKVDYAYLGTSTTALYPQLVQHFKLAVKQGLWVQQLLPGGPAGRAGLRGGRNPVVFQASRVFTGGDIITAFDGKPLRKSDDLNAAVNARKPGDTITLTVERGSQNKQIKVKLAARPLQSPSPSSGG